MPGRTVLMAEDEKALLDLVSEELQDAGFSVLRAMTAEDALEIIRGEEALDVLFTDIRFPKPLDGWRLAEVARDIRPGLKVIYATGFSVDTPRLVPGSKFFKKPYRPSAIIAAVEGLLTDQ